MIDKEKNTFIMEVRSVIRKKTALTLRCTLKRENEKNLHNDGFAPGAFAVGMRGEIGARSRPCTGGRLFCSAGAGIRRSSGGAGRCVPKNACKYAGFYNNEEGL